MENERIWGLGGLARAHIRYFDHPAVIADLADGLGGNARPVRIPWIQRARDAMAGMLENLIVPIGAMLALLAGVAAFLLFGAMLGAFVATLFYPLYGWLSNVRFASAVYWTSIVCAAWMIAGVVLFTTKDGYRRAREAHRRHWQ